MRLISIVLLALVVLLGLLFAVLNPGSVKLNLGFGPSELPLSLALAFAFALGSLCGIAAATAIIFRLKRANRRLQRSLQGSVRDSSVNGPAIARERLE